MAPEAFKHKRNQQTDIWSVGVLLYQMLSGRLPFIGADIAEVYGAIRDEDPAPLPAAVPEGLRQIVAKSLIKDPEQRFKTAAEMRAALSPQPQPARVEPAPPLRRTVTVDEPVSKLEPVPPPPKPKPIVVKPEPKLVRQPGQRPAVRWGGAGLVAIVIAVATYLATKTPSTTSPNSLNAVGDSQQPAASGNEFAINLANGVKIQMVNLPGGEFTMGGDRESDEKPPHTVRVSPFAIGKYEVTQAQWKAVMGSNPSNNQGDDLPVEKVSWDDVQDFLKKVGSGFRLPTEAEWEYAARAGSTTAYSFGDSESQLGEYAWFDNNSGGKTHPVGGMKPNPFGLFDLYGNVGEWCSDWYSGSYYAECQRQGAVTDPRGPGISSDRVVRGGGWYISAVDCRSAKRHDVATVESYDSLGFRLVRIGR